MLLIEGYESISNGIRSGSSDRLEALEIGCSEATNMVLGYGFFEARGLLIEEEKLMGFIRKGPKLVVEAEINFRKV